jgi:hypothetical protein
VGGGEVSPYFALSWKRLKNSPLRSNLNKSSKHCVAHDGVSGFDAPDWTGEGYPRRQRAFGLLCGGGGGFTLFRIVLEMVKEAPPSLEFK